MRSHPSLRLGSLALLSLSLAATTARAAGLEIKGVVSDDATRSPLSASVTILDDHDGELAKDVAAPAGRIAIALPRFTGSHVICQVSAPEFSPRTVAAAVKLATADCSARLERLPALRIDAFAAGKDPQGNPVLVWRFKNETSQSQAVSRLSIAGIWRSELACAEPAQNVQIDVSLKLQLRDGKSVVNGIVKQEGDVHTTLQLEKASGNQNRCTYTCLRIPIESTFSVAPNGERWVNVNLLAANGKLLELPEDTESGFAVRARYADKRMASAQSLSAENPLLTALQSDPRCRVEP